MGAGAVAGKVIIGQRDAARTAALQVELAARGRDVVAADGPTERLVALAVESYGAVLVLDGLLSGAALRAVAQAVRAESDVGVLVVGPLKPTSEILVALASGVSSYIAADSPPDEVANAVDALFAGTIVLPRGITLPVLVQPSGGERGVTIDWVDGRAVELTHREWEVFVLIRQGQSTSDIARHLVVSHPTVRTHVAALVHKFGVPDRAALAVPPMWAQRHPGR